MMMQCQQEGVNPFGETPTPPSDVDVPAFCMKVMTADPTTFADEQNALQIKYPCAFVQCGSATGCIIVSMWSACALRNALRHENMDVVRSDIVALLYV